MPEIPVPPSEVPLSSAGAIVPPTAADATGVPETQDEPYAISFASYIESECQITGMSKANSVAALKILKDVGLSYRGPGTLSTSFVDRVERIRREGDYLRVCAGVAEEIDVMELVYKKERPRDQNNSIDLRVFYYSLSNNRTFYLLAIRQDHYNLDHSSGSRR